MFVSNHIENNLLFLPIFFCLAHFLISVFARVLANKLSIRELILRHKNIIVFALYVFMDVYSRYKYAFTK